MLFSVNACIQHNIPDRRINSRKQTCSVLTLVVTYFIRDNTTVHPLNNNKNKETMGRQLRPLYLNVSFYLTIVEFSTYHNAFANCFVFGFPKFLDSKIKFYEHSSLSLADFSLVIY